MGLFRRGVWGSWGETSRAVRPQPMTALSTFVKTWSFFGETGTAVITVRLRTETTNAVESTSTSDSREPLAAALSTAASRRAATGSSKAISRRWMRCSAWLDSFSGSLAA